MSEPKFTSGEWNVQFSDMIFATKDGVHNEQVAIVVSEDNHDAELIAAAPKMYALLEELESALMQSEHIRGEYICEITDILAKARGEI